MNMFIFKPIKILSFLWLALFPAAKLWGHEGSHVYSLPIEKIAEVDTLEAISLYGQLSAYHPEAKEHFREALLRRGDVEAFLRKTLDELPQTPFNGNHRNIFFRVMSDLRTPWAARICGEQLLSDDKVILPEFQTEKEAYDFFTQDGVSNMPNSVYAMLALEEMNIDTAPKEVSMRTPSSRKPKKDLWREWWRKNEVNIEGLLAVENKPNSTNKDNPISAAGDQTNLQHPDNKPSEVPNIGPHRVKAMETYELFGWGIPFGIMLFFLAVAGWLIYLKRRADKP